MLCHASYLTLLSNNTICTRKEPGGVFLGLLKKDLPDDDIKYIFTVEFERESEYHLGELEPCNFLQFIECLPDWMLYNAAIVWLYMGHKPSSAFGPIVDRPYNYENCS